MAHSTVDSWKTFFTDAGIPIAESDKYAQTFTDNRILDPKDLTRDLLKDLQITIVGDIIAIMKQVDIRKTDDLREPDAPSRPSAKAPLVHIPQLKPDMTHAEFRKFGIDWSVFKQLARISDDQIPLHIYNACDAAVQNSIINTTDNFFKSPEATILEILEKIVTKRSNPAVHRLTFGGIVQSQAEPIKDFIVRLKSAAKDCEFECPK